MSEKPLELLIPGPVPVHHDVLAAMGQPVRQHYGPEWVPFYEEFTGKLRRVFSTAGSVYPIPASGSGGLEAMLATLTPPRKSSFLPSAVHLVPFEERKSPPPIWRS